MTKVKDDELREALRDALILWEQGGQELLERIINGEKNAVDKWKEEQGVKNENS
tara:strand:- start:7790 stop:7951 length:162 start_codon:yes stop_codon:yes gene_type:complete